MEIKSLLELLTLTITELFQDFVMQHLLKQHLSSQDLNQVQLLSPRQINSMNLYGELVSKASLRLGYIIFFHDIVATMPAFLI